MLLKDKIVSIREENDLTQEDLAEILCVSRQTVSNWENAKCFPDIETLIMMSEKFGISLDVLLKGDRDMVKDMDKKIKNGKWKLPLIAIACTAIMLSLVVIWATYKSLFIYYYSTDEEYFREVIKTTKSLNIKSDKSLANTEFVNLHLYVPNDNVIRKTEDNSELIYEKNGMTSLWINVSSINIDKKNADERLSTLGFDEYNLARKYDISSERDLLEYYEEHLYDRPNLFWPTDRIQMRFLSLYYLLSRVRRQDNIGEFYIINGEEIEGDMSVNGNYRVVLLANEKKIYYLRFNRNFYDVDEIEYILSSCHFE